jgi:pimeloyl-ACP methyl ester carboxylesterase
VAQDKLAALSSNSRLVIVAGSSHTIQWDQPDSVLQAVRDVVESARTGQPLTR